MTDRPTVKIGPEDCLPEDYQIRQIIAEAKSGVIRKQDLPRVIALMEAALSTPAQPEPTGVNPAPANRAALDPFEECHNWKPGWAFKYIGDDESMKHEVHYFVGHTPVGPWCQIFIAEIPGRQRLHWNGFPNQYERWPKHDKPITQPEPGGNLKYAIGLIENEVLKEADSHLRNRPDATATFAKTLIDNWKVVREAALSTPALVSQNPEKMSDKEVCASQMGDNQAQPDLTWLDAMKKDLIFDDNLNNPQSQRDWNAAIDAVKERMGRPIPDEGEPSFVLLARDPQAPDLVDKWARDRRAAMPDSPKPDMAQKIAYKMRIWKNEHPGRGMPATMLSEAPQDKGAE